MLKNFLSAFVALLFLAGCSAGSGSYSGHNAHLMEFEKSVGDRVFFGLDSSKLSDESKATLDRQVKWLMAHDKYTITVAGHCDERGTREYNIALGERRAESVKRYLVSKGLDAGRIETISYGKERPAVIGNNERAWSQNRRAVTAIR